jgi:ABC-type amino acid transport system permease subunit
MIRTRWPPAPGSSPRTLMFLPISRCLLALSLMVGAVCASAVVGAIAEAPRAAIEIAASAGLRRRMLRPCGVVFTFEHPFSALACGVS